MKTADYGIDGPLVLLSLGIIGCIAAVWALLNIFQIISIPSELAFSLVLLSFFIVAFNSFCILISFWSSKVGKINEAKRILNSYRWNGNENVLDVGCGRGLMLIHAAKRLVTGKAVGVDIWDSRDQTGNCPKNTFRNARIENVGERVTIVEGDARNLPFDSDTFDVVLSNKVFHNITNLKQRENALQECIRVLKPGGWLGIIDSFQYATDLKNLGWKNFKASKRRYKMFPPIKWTFGNKPEESQNKKIA